jgi:vacuolar protein sorting-associated protein 13A/C
VFEQELDRQRLPRFIGNDGILKVYTHSYKQVYDAREALGQSLMKTAEAGIYVNEDYLAHLDLLGVDQAFALVTNKRVILLRQRRMRQDWSLEYGDLQLVRTKGNVVVLMQKGGRGEMGREREVVCPEGSGAAWLCKRIEGGFFAYLASTRALD